MKSINKALLTSTQNMDWTSDAVHVGQSAVFSIQAFYTTSSAEVKLQASNDKGAENAESLSAAQADLMNWSDLDNSTVSLTENGDILYDLDNVSYKWVRIVFVGTGTVTSCRINAKG